MDEVLIFHQNKAFGLEEAFQVLLDRHLTVTRDGERLSVHWHDGPTLYVQMLPNLEAQRRALEIAQGTEHESALNGCGLALRITFDDLDSVLDEINTLIEVQCTLQDATQGYIYVPWNRSLLPPEESF